MPLLKSNFELGIPKICNLVIEVYGKILKETSKGDLDISEIQNHFKMAKYSGGSTQYLIKHLDDASDFIKQCFESDIQALISSENQQSLSVIFQRALNFVQSLEGNHSATIYHILASSLPQVSSNPDFIHRALSMISFYCIKMNQSTLLPLFTSFKDQDTFLLTIMKLAIKESTLFESIFALTVTQIYKNSNKVILPILEY